MREQVAELGASALALSQGLLDADIYPGKGFWLLTTGAQVVAQEAVAGLSGSPLWGLGKNLQLESPVLSVSLLDLDTSLPEVSEALIEMLLYPDGETELHCDQANAFQTNCCLWINRLQSIGKISMALP